jgi:hypothetical protein
MHSSNHISKNKFYEVLEKRLHEYKEAIFGNRVDFGMNLEMTQASLYSINKLKAIDSQTNLFGSGFWGYGINNISVGKETHSHLDVEEIKRIGGLNKHHEDYRVLLLLIFKVENGALFGNFFSIDTCKVNFNSNINIKYDLKDFDNAELKLRGNNIFLDFYFKDFEKPVSFQIETYNVGGHLSGMPLAQYYIDRITELAKEIKKHDKTINSIDKGNSELNKQIDRIENELRILVADILIVQTGKEDFESLLTGDTKQQVRRRIEQHVAKHPNKTIEDFKLLKNSIEFFDIEHLKKLILRIDFWQYFESKFKDKFKVEKYFDQLSELRHVVKHTREMTDLILFEGKAALEWLEMVMN